MLLSLIGLPPNNTVKVHPKQTESNKQTDNNNDSEMSKDRNGLVTVDVQQKDKSGLPPVEGKAKDFMNAFYADTNDNLLISRQFGQRSLRRRAITYSFRFFEEDLISAMTFSAAIRARVIQISARERRRKHEIKLFFQ